MKVLIAANGNTLNDLIARRFESATWFLIADTHNLHVTCVENLGPRSRQEIVARAVNEGVDTIITSGLGLQSYNLAATFRMKIAIAPEMAAREVIQRIRGGKLPIFESGIIGEIVHEQILNRMHQRMHFREKETRGAIRRTLGTRS